eukprot:COSAG02_NODE_67709_length_252_cov_0.679739_1_plen_56_part_01
MRWGGIKGVALHNDVAVQVEDIGLLIPEGAAGSHVSATMSTQGVFLPLPAPAPRGM